MTITLNEQGQISIPEDIRTRLGWKPGTKFVFDADENGELILRPERIPQSIDEERFRQVIGSVPPWPGSTDAYMEFLRGPFEELPPLPE
jgi:AbrB family looped-hinge helix DNA binding protein